MTRGDTLELAAAARRLAELLERSVGQESAPGHDLSVAELGQRLNRTSSTVRGWIENGEFPGAYKLPGDPKRAAWRVPLSAVEAFRNRESGNAIGEWRKRRKGKVA